MVVLLAGLLVGMVWYAVKATHADQRKIAFAGEDQPLTSNSSNTYGSYDGVVMEVSPVPNNQDLWAIRYVEFQKDGGYSKLRGGIIPVNEVNIGGHVHCESVGIFNVSGVSSWMMMSCKKIDSNHKHES